jgi:hypothetical protein
MYMYSGTFLQTAPSSFAKVQHTVCLSVDSALLLLCKVCVADEVAQSIVVTQQAFVRLTSVVWHSSSAVLQCSDTV